MPKSQVIIHTPNYMRLYSGTFLSVHIIWFLTQTYNRNNIQTSMTVLYIEIY